jgi:hypothetical protein
VGYDLSPGRAFQVAIIATVGTIMKIANAKLTGLAKYRTDYEMDYRNIKWSAK